jgi:hypothetical protein
MGDMMLRSMPLRFAAGALIAGAAVSLFAASASAFNQENLQSGGTGSAAIADPDDQFTNSGQGVHPFGANGPTLQFGIQQHTGTPFGSFQGNDRDGSPPDPYFHPPGNGNN